MDIRMSSLLQGAQNAEGTVVIIDVFRAFTTAAIAFSRGALKIILVAEIDEALDIRDRGIASLCIGEVGGVRPTQFDYGNSPYEISQADFANRVIVQSTRAGTVGVASARKAESLYVCSLVVAGATAQIIRRDSPDRVSLVAMGVEGRDRSDEDEQCGLYLRNLLQGRTPDHHAVRKLILAGSESQKYEDSLLPQFDPKDVEMALQIDSLPFGIRVAAEDGLLVAHPEYP